MDNILLIDGKNTAYRALFAARGNPEFRRSGYHPFVVWLRFVHVWLEKFKPVSCHVFWDCPKNEVWRKKVLSEYKDHRDTMVHYEDDVQEQMASMIGAATDILQYMGVRQYIRAGQECDDLIFSACRLLNPGKADTTRVIVVSSDSDFLQLQWHMPHVSCYLPKDGKFADQPDCDPAIQKALSGDKADNVDGFRGIGPVKSRQLTSNPTKLLEFLESVDKRKFKRNLALIDLSLNPHALSNQLYVMDIMSKSVIFDRGKIQDFSVKHHANGMMSEYTRVAVAFKHLR